MTNEANADEIVPEVVVETPAAPETPSPVDAFEARMAQLEASQQLTTAQLRQLNTAVGRAQSLADKFDKTGDPKVEDKVRAAMAEVYDVLSDVSDSIDSAILPDSAKRKVASAKEATRKAADKAEVDRAVREAVAAATPPPAQTEVDVYSNAVELQVVTELTGLGISPDDPAINWAHAASLLHGAGGAASMWQYIRGVEKTLEKTDAGEGPTRRPTPSPKAAGVAETTTIDTLLAQYSTDPTKMKPEQRAEVEKYMFGAGVLK